MPQKQVFPVKVFILGGGLIDSSGTLVFEPGIMLDEPGELSISVFLPTDKKNETKIKVENLSPLKERVWYLTIVCQTHNSGNHDYKYKFTVDEFCDHETAEGKKVRARREKKQAESKSKRR